MEQDRQELIELWYQADALQRCRILLMLARQYEDWRLRPDIRERVERARALWERRN
jgi:hypothetical protein